MMYVVFLLIFLFYGGANYYIARRLFLWFRLLFPHMNGIVFGILFGLCAITTVLSFVNNNSDTKIMGLIGRFGDLWMGVFAYLLCLFLISDGVLWVMKSFGVIATPYAHKLLFVRGSFVIVLVFGLCAYGRYHAHQIQDKSYSIQIEKETSLNKLKVIVISDLHLGYTNDVASLEETVQHINTLEADVVLIAGDIFNGSYRAVANPSKAIAIMKRIQSTYGVYACLGNHDAGTGYPEMEKFLEQSNIALLKDEAKIINDQFILVGRRDSSPIGEQGSRRSEVKSKLSEEDKKKPIIVLDHQPANLVEYEKGIDLIVSGHTHNGQLFPGNLITKAMFTNSYGYYQKEAGSPQVIVTSGVGTWGPPLRIGTDNEIVSIMITFT